MPRIISLIGISDSGKTGLIESLLDLAVKKDLKAGAVKYAPHGFDVDTPGKDTDRFSKSGAASVAVLSGTGSVVFNNIKADINKMLFDYFWSYDLVLLEGFRDAELSKILVLGRDEEIPSAFAEDIIALYSEDELSREIGINKFSTGDHEKMLDMIMDLPENKVELRVDGEKVMMNKFVSEIISNTLTSIVLQLNLPTYDFNNIELKVKREKD